MLNKVKICFILSHLPQGGAERQTLNLIKGLDPLKYDITLLIYSINYIFYQEVFDLPLNIIINESVYRNKLLKNFKNALYLRKFLNRNDFDILHTLLYHNGFWVRLVAPTKYNQRIVYSIRNSLKDCPKFFLPFEKMFIKKSFVITNSLKSKHEFIKLVGNKYLNRISNIYNGIDSDRFASLKIPALSDEIIIGTVGRQTAQKNQIQILYVINQVKNECLIHFYLIGDKSSGKAIELEKYVKDNELDSYVTIMDSQLKVEEYYKQFNIFVLSSIYEGCPNVLFEALLSKCLCIVSEGANSDNYIKDGYNGFVYDGSNEMLESKLKYAIKMLKNEEASEIIHNGYHYALDNFSMNKMVLSYEKIYELLLKSNDKIL